MKKIVKTLLLTPLILGAAASLSSCNKTTKLTLRILNSEDYIYLNDPKNGYDEPDLVDQFVDYINENYPEYRGLTVIYDTSDTNETIYSEIQTGKSNYDLVNVSEYMAQKIVSGGFAIELDMDRIPNYEQFASKEIKSRLDNIPAVQKVYNDETGKYEDKTVYLRDYAVGYMWGTLGILFNPDFSVFEQRGISREEVIEDMQSFDAFWDSKYNGTISIKNSMRDTYALGIMHTYEEEFAALKEQYESGEITSQVYQEEFSKIFNRSDEKSVGEVQRSLEELKGNIFGLEVDSGKQDIITQKIGINFAWSGDAAYSIEQAEDVGVELLYSLPELGGNLWNDVWVMPNISRSDEQNELAHLFLDFLCDPEIATKNISYTGYTSYIGGDDVLELARDWYDYRTEEMYVDVDVINDKDEAATFEYCPIYSINGSDFVAVSYDDFILERHDDTRDNDELYYFLPYEIEEEVDGELQTVLVEEPLDYDDLIAHGNYVHNFEDEEEVETLVIESSEEGSIEDLIYSGEYEKVDPEEEAQRRVYADLTIVNAPDSEIEAVDLSYFFNGTLYTSFEEKYGQEEYERMVAEGEEGVLYQDNIDTIFYSDSYLPYTYIDENGDEQQNISVGGMFFCQFPSEEVILRCAVMEDYGTNNNYVMKMWENFKSDALPAWAIVVFIVVLVLILLLISYFVVNYFLHKKVVKLRK